jgi:hypothetical protein
MRALIGKGAVVARYAYSERIYYNLERGERLYVASLLNVSPTTVDLCILDTR